jgi:dolichol kinase
LGDLATVIGFSALLVAALLLARRAGKALDLGPEVRRKIVHVGLGFSVLTLPLLFDTVASVLLLCAASIAILLAARFNPRLGAALHGVGRSSYGEIYFALSVAVLFVLQAVGERAGLSAMQIGADRSVFFIVPIAVMTLSDTAAALAGTEYGKRVFPVEKGTKSLEGAVAFFIVTWLVSIILLLLLTEIPRDTVIALSGLVALVGATIEIESWAGLDNLFVPIGLHIILVAMAPAGVLQIVGVAGFYALAVAFAFHIARARDVSQQPLRAAILLLVVVLLSFDPLNAALLACVLAVTIMANRMARQSEAHAELHTIFAVIAIGIFWMVLGNMTGRNLILYFAITITGYGAAMAALALTRHKIWLLLTIAGFSALLAARIAIEALGPVTARVLIAYGVASIAALSILCAFRPALFARRRAAKIAMLVPTLPPAIFGALQ